MVTERDHFHYRTLFDKINRLGNAKIAYPSDAIGRVEEMLRDDAIGRRIQELKEEARRMYENFTPKRKELADALCAGYFESE